MSNINIPLHIYLFNLPACFLLPAVPSFQFYWILVPLPDIISPIDRVIHNNRHTSHSNQLCSHTAGLQYVFWYHFLQFGFPFAHIGRTHFWHQRTAALIFTVISFGFSRAAHRDNGSKTRPSLALDPRLGEATPHRRVSTLARLVTSSETPPHKHSSWPSLLAWMKKSSYFRKWFYWKYHNLFEDIK